MAQVTWLLLANQSAVILMTSGLELKLPRLFNVVNKKKIATCDMITFLRCRLLLNHFVANQPKRDQ